MLEEKLTHKFKNGYENFSDVKVSIVLNFLLGCPKSKKVQRFTWNPFVGIYWTNLLPKLCFQTPRSLFRTWDLSVF
jgi:hypothetical protein